MQRYQQGERFAFGRNWKRFIDQYLADEWVASAQAQLTSFLGLQTLKDRTFLDIGCGSGLFSYIAHRLGATRIVSFDYDKDSVEATERLREHAGSPSQWHVSQGSILDKDFVARLPHSDVVYAWGVLHHTGDMWSAIRNAAGLVEENGYFYIAIYNKQEYKTLRTIRGSHFWLKIKKLYNRGGWPARAALEGWYRGKEITKMLLALRNPVREIRAYSSLRIRES